VVRPDVMVVCRSQSGIDLDRRITFA